MAPTMWRLSWLQFGNQHALRLGKQASASVEPASRQSGLPSSVAASGFHGIDRLLPGGGIVRGSLVEWIGGPA
jgi:hypothetical protein